MREILIVAKKELCEFLRSTSTLLLFLTPILILPLFSFGLDYINQNQETEIRIVVQSSDTESSAIFQDFISCSDKMRIHVIESTTPLELLQKRKIDCILYIKQDEFRFISDSSSYNSLSLTAKLGECFENFYLANLENQKVNIHNFSLRDENNRMIDTATSISNIFFPIILVVLIFQNPLTFSNDLFAGERERKTLELLLTCGAKRSLIYWGKILSLFLISSVNLLISMASCILSTFFSGDGFRTFKFLQNGILIYNVLTIIGTLILLAVSAVILPSTVSIISKGMRSAQIGNEFLLAIPLGSSVIIALGIVQNDNILLTAIPIFGTIKCFTSAFSGNVFLPEIIVSSLSTFILISLMTWISIKYMNSEKILQ